MGKYDGMETDNPRFIAALDEAFETIEEIRDLFKDLDRRYEQYLAVAAEAA